MESACADGLEFGSFVNDPYNRRLHRLPFVGALHEAPAYPIARSAPYISTLHVPLCSVLFSDAEALKNALRDILPHARAGELADCLHGRFRLGEDGVGREARLHGLLRCTER